MSALLNFLARDGLGAFDDTIAPSQFVNGLGVEGEQRLAVEDGAAIDHYHQGLPFSSTGRVCVSLGATVAKVGNGGAPFDANGMLCLSTDPVTNHANGVAYDQQGRIVLS